MVRYGKYLKMTDEEFEECLKQEHAQEEMEREAKRVRVCNDKVLQSFLAELTNLTKSYGWYIGGCGCCGSLFLARLDGYEVLDNLRYDEDTNKYVIRGDD